MENKVISVPELTPIYPATKHENFRDLINFAASNYGSSDAFILKTKKAKGGKPAEYKHISYKKFKQDIDNFGAGLMKSKLIGKRFAIIGKNSYKWLVSYYAVLCGLGVCVPLDKGLPYDEVETSLIKSKSEILIFDEEHEDMARKIKASENTGISTYICMEDIRGYELFSWILHKGKQAVQNGYKEFGTLPINPKAISVLLFTSGTTSNAKAVMLSQFNILENVYSLELVEDIQPGDVNMAFLPFHHTFGSTGQTLMLARGVTTTFCDGLKYIQKNMVEYKVSIFICVPLLIEAMYKKLLAGVKKRKKEKTLARGIKISNFLRRHRIDVRRKIFSDIIKEFGGSLRFIISGASPLDPEVAKGFDQLGIDLVQGYGMTEASPVLTAENPNTRKAGSIGKAMPGVSLKIINPNEEGVGELIAKGSNIMAGYYEDYEATSETLIGGWLHTGDLAETDSDGFVFLRGRAKNVIVLKNGKNIYPEEIETLIAGFPYVKENLVYGSPRHRDGDTKDLVLCAKIVYDKDYFKSNFGTWDSDKIQRIISRDIDKLSDSMPAYKRIHRLTVTHQEMVKTTTGKVKRYIEK
ncbi:MAG: AMP-binding protein [Hornefia sp.]|nr:AMP-binding protein [Hornefia sp.]